VENVVFGFSENAKLESLALSSNPPFLRKMYRFHEGAGRNLEAQNVSHLSFSASVSGGGCVRKTDTFSLSPPLAMRNWDVEAQKTDNSLPPSPKR